MPISGNANIGFGSKQEDFFWGCLPYVTTPHDVVHRMLAIAEVGPSDVVMDLGCGDGRILLAAVSDFGARMAIGYEIREDLLMEARKGFEEKHLGDRVKLVKGDLKGADLAEATVIAIYLTATGNERLMSKVEDEVRPGTRIVSHGYSVGDWVPSKLENFLGHRIYLYVAPGAFKRR